ncbi:MAG: LmbE family protein [Bacteroidota bacterium]|jgi:LmbE family N-acetylglucosaminyl deacetylase|nr:LmbE family protein [Bacteroidota bacterium]
MSDFKFLFSDSMKKHFLLCFNLFAFAAFAQTPRSMNSAEILQGLMKLKNATSVLYIAAHPDDENTRLLGYLANEQKARTGYLSLTRGDGGQNLVGKEQGELLGLIRTQELLAARRTDGAEQFFTRANDFGFSKNPEETFSFWNKDSVLSDVVLAIRRFRPDVIICRFPTTGEGGHGHHTASAILAVEAFDAAADPKRFPEQLKSTEVWQAKRIFWNTFNFGTTNTTSPDQLKIDVGGYNALLGKNYGEIAAESRSCHKSQGFGSARQRGSSIEYFKLLKGDSVKTDLFEGIKKDWSRFKGQEKILKVIDDCIKKYDPQFPAKSVNDLVAIHNQLNNLDEKIPELKYWKKQKLKETEELLLACAGLWMEATASDYIGIPGEDVAVNVQLLKRNAVDAKLNKITYLQSDTTTALDLKNNELYTFKRKEKLSAEAAFSNPYWLNEKHETGMYKVQSVAMIGKPENENSTKVVFNITLAGLPLNIERGIVFKSTDPVKGEIYRPFEILPPVTINFPEKVFVFTDGNAKTFLITVKANTASVSGRLNIIAGSGWKINILSPDFKLSAKGDEVTIPVSIMADEHAVDGKIEASAMVNGSSFNKSIKRIEYDHIPYQFILSDSEAGLVHIDLKKSGIEIGYIPGAGDDVPASLKQIGYNVTILTDELLSNTDLSKYNAIVSGIRAYNTNDRLQVHYSKLMEYVIKGGNLIVQYNTNNRIGPVQAKIGPYPFTISRDRVTNENAEVKILGDKHPVLNFPNAITQKDFEGWIQERGIYFATEIDKQYEKIFSMNDPDDKASEGSLIIAKYGKGNFVYTGLVFFRELPAGVPGAYRLFVNLLSLPQNK